MNESLIQKAAKSLLIQRVNLQSSQIECDEVFALNDSKQDCQIKVGRGLVNYTILESEEQSQDGNKLVVFLYQCGIKFEPEVAEDDDSEEDCSKLVIEARFSALYSMDKDIDDETLKEFGRFNVPYHVWPYWREYAQSTFSRMGIEPVPIPVYRVPKTAED